MSLSPEILWKNTAEGKNLGSKHDQLTDILCDSQISLIHVFVAKAQYSHISLFMG